MFICIASSVCLSACNGRSTRNHFPELITKEKIVLHEKEERFFGGKDRTYYASFLTNKKGIEIVLSQRNYVLVDKTDLRYGGVSQMNFEILAAAKQEDFSKISYYRAEAPGKIYLLGINYKKNRVFFSYVEW